VPTHLHRQLTLALEKTVDEADSDKGNLAIAAHFLDEEKTVFEPIFRGFQAVCIGTIGWREHAGPGHLRRMHSSSYW
jgi:hypothetical protein